LLILEGWDKRVVTDNVGLSNFCQSCTFLLFTRGFKKLLEFVWI